MPLLRELILDLPSEPPRAIVTFADRVKGVILDKSKRDEKAEEYDAIASYAMKFCAKYKIPLHVRQGQFTGYELMDTVIRQIIADRSKILSGAVDSEVDNILIEYDSGIGESFGVARLNPEEKKKIHEHISRIRQIIEESTLSDRKKNALFDRLNQLAKEVDLHGTRTDRFFAFLSDLGFAMGEFGVGAKPLFEEARGMIQAVSRARARQEGVSLPPGDEPLRLPSPEVGS